MKANVDGDDDDDDRGGVSERQACVLEEPPTFTPARRVAYRVFLFSSFQLPPSSVPPVPRAGGHEATS